MKPKISHKTVTEIRKELLRARGQNAWTSFSTELQDDSRFLLISVELPYNAGEQQYKDACKALQSIVADRILPVPLEYSWMGVVTVGGKVVESVMSEMLTAQ